MGISKATANNNVAGLSGAENLPSALPSAARPSGRQQQRLGGKLFRGGSFPRFDRSGIKYWKYGVCTLHKSISNILSDMQDWSVGWFASRKIDAPGWCGVGFSRNFT